MYSNNEQVAFEIKNTISFILTHPKMKFLGINPIKYVQDLYEKKYKTHERNQWTKMFIFMARKTYYYQDIDSSQLTDSMQYQSNSQWIVLWILTNWF